MRHSLLAYSLLLLSCGQNSSTNSVPAGTGASGASSAGAGGSSISTTGGGSHAGGSAGEVSSSGGSAQSLAEAPPLPATGCTAPALTSGMHSMIVKSGGLDRTYLLWVPTSARYDASKPTPVVLEFHGGGGRASSFDSETLWSAKGDSSGFLVVAPDGIVGGTTMGKPKEYWNSGATCGVATQMMIDDVGFVRDLLNQLATIACVDSRRIFAAGHSEGGGMAHRLGCELSEYIAAIAPASNAATLYPQDPATHPGQTPAYACNVKRPVSVFEMHGLLDCTNPYLGGYVMGGGCNQYNPNVSETFGWWGRNDGCSGGEGPATVIPLANGEGEASCSSRQGCPAGTDVSLCTFSTAGHEWFGSGKDACSMFDPRIVPVSTWKATDQAWEFFTAHPKR